MSSIKRELIESINRLDTEKQEQVLEFVRSIENAATLKTYSPRELMRLPFEERNKIVAAALQRSVEDDVELFDANSEADFDDT
jgi:ERCC4-type nuclease